MRLILLLASLSLVPILVLGESESDVQGPPVLSQQSVSQQISTITVIDHIKDHHVTVSKI